MVFSIVTPTFKQPEWVRLLKCRRYNGKYHPGFLTTMTWLVHDQSHVAKLFLANQETFFDRSPDAALSSGMNAIEIRNMGPALRHKAFEIDHSLGFGVISIKASPRDIYLAVRQDGRRGSGSSAGSLRCEFCGQIRCDSGALSRRY